MKRVHAGSKFCDLGTFDPPKINAFSRSMSLIEGYDGLAPVCEIMACRRTAAEKGSKQYWAVGSGAAAGVRSVVPILNPTDLVVLESAFP